MATFFRRTKRAKSLRFDTFSTFSVSFLRETGWKAAIIDRFRRSGAVFVLLSSAPSGAVRIFCGGVDRCTQAAVPVSLYLYCMQFMITLIIISFSSGLDSAIMIVSATNVASSILFFPSENSASFLSRKYKNIVAAILLFPSKKLWFFVTKYKRLAGSCSDDRKNPANRAHCCISLWQKAPAYCPDRSASVS